MAATSVIKIVSGGQTGVDRAALDVAIEIGIPHGGWCPRGRRAEDGAIDARYLLQETDEADYSIRTEMNVRDSDATLILNRSGLTGGTKFTVQCARRLQKPYLVVALDEPRLLDTRQIVIDWLVTEKPQVLNIAGPRETTQSGIYAAAREFLANVLCRQ